ncbi:hypothetical protein SynBIOSE41_01483 [Synechococcus sp. BIOS-E4-1]|nr:hypothetical protein SynBIOSE41_01483 [Synechococcus sp. BIOS-E4-1]
MGEIKAGIKLSKKLLDNQIRMAVPNQSACLQSGTVPALHPPCAAA